MEILYLGTAAAEGWPALFCGCEICKRARAAGGKELRTRTQSIKSSNFTYEMVHIQGKTAMDGGFRKRGHGCPLLPPRPDSKAFLHFISEICFLSQPQNRTLHGPKTLPAVPPMKIDFCGGFRKNTAENFVFIDFCWNIGLEDKYSTYVCLQQIIFYIIVLFTFVYISQV